MTQPLDLDHLERVAREATPGKWSRMLAPDPRLVFVIGPDGVLVCECGDLTNKGPALADAAHIAAFDPPTVLALLARLRAAEARADDAERRGWIMGRDTTAHSQNEKEFRMSEDQDKFLLRMEVQYGYQYTGETKPSVKTEDLRRMLDICKGYNFYSRELSIIKMGDAIYKVISHEDISKPDCEIAARAALDALTPPQEPSTNG